MNRDGREAILSVNGLTTEYVVRKAGTSGAARLVAVDGVSLDIGAGETLGLVGESGCGKSTLGRTIMRLLEPANGSVTFRGQDITHLGHGGLRPLRRHMQMVFQDPFASLNPRFTVRRILSEPFRIHGDPKAEADSRIPELLELVHLPSDVAERFPHEFSGGQRQRIAIARALALRPSLIVLDEPVSALDVSIQAQILNLLDDLRHDLGLAYLFIAHDLSVVGQVSDRVDVMYLGRIVETGSRHDVFANPQHPYTIALLSAVPSPRKAMGGSRRSRIVLQGDLPNPLDPPSGCRFRTRCWRADEICATKDPQLSSVAKSGSMVACHHPGPEPPRGSTVNVVINQGPQQ